MAGSRFLALCLLALLALPAAALSSERRTPSPSEDGLPKSAAEEVVTVAELLKNKKAYDGRNLCVSGKTSTLFQKYSRKGNHYYSVWVSEGKWKIKVFSFGFPSFKEGDVIEACGLFLREKWVSGRVFYDEFSAQVILTGSAMRSGRVEVSSAGVVAVEPPKRGK
ncbi:MAG: hypothetical protein HY922_15530 [Elusimicrobia bacterium]|nr:hypothetical protein [Elusimicrobiota bacterium]